MTLTLEAVREATEADLPQLLVWGERFHAGSNWAHTPFSRDNVCSTLKRLLSEDDAAILCHDHGMIGGFVSPLWFSDRHVLAQELFWFAERDGGQLLKAFEAWAVSKGASYLMMTGLKDETGRIQAVYARKGFEVAEYNYRKALHQWPLEQPLELQPERRQAS